MQTYWTYQPMYYMPTGQPRPKINWANQASQIQEWLDEGISLKEIGEKYSVSRQRMYQVLQKYGIQTPVHKRKTILDGKGPAHYWLNKMLSQKGMSYKDRLWALEHLPLPEVCPVLGIKLNYDGIGVGESGFTREDNSPSIDQIIPSEGYTLDNIAVISWRANRIKNDGNAEEHQKIADWLTDLTK